MNIISAFAPAETPGGPEIFEDDRWRALLEQAIDKLRISLLAQPVRTVDLGEVHHDLRPRAPDDRGDRVRVSEVDQVMRQAGL